MKTSLIFLTLILLIALPIQADKIYLKSGTVLEGQITPRGHHYLVVTATDSLLVRADQVDRIETIRPPIPGDIIRITLTDGMVLEGEVIESSIDRTILLSNEKQVLIPQERIAEVTIVNMATPEIPKQPVVEHFLDEPDTLTKPSSSVRFVGGLVWMVFAGLVISSLVP